MNMAWHHDNIMLTGVDAKTNDMFALTLGGYWQFYGTYKISLTLA